MNVYDFDGTIYPGDSSKDFFLYCARRHPSCLKVLPGFLRAMTAYKAGKGTLEDAKQRYFGFLAQLDDPEEEVRRFWEERSSRFYDWYVSQHAPDDVVVSASPRFLVQPACELLGIRHVIATEMDINDGTILTPNCKGKEKVRRFFEVLPDAQIDGFYSDSQKNDLPMAQLASSAWIVRKGDVHPWPD